MRDPALYEKRGTNGGLHRSGQPGEEIQLMEAMRARWGAILGWASSTESWDPEEIPAFSSMLLLL